VSPKLDENVRLSLWEMLNSYLPREIDINEMKNFLFKPLPNNKILNCKIILRAENTFGKMYPIYFLYVYNNDRFLLSAKKIFKTTATNYYIFNDMDDMNENSNCFIGKISSNFLSTEFNIYDKGRKAEKNVKSSDLRINYGTVIYVNIFHSRKRIYLE
jgi:hypothetical protein